MTAPKVKRRPAPKKVDFYWFQGESVAELVRRLSVTGPQARLEVRISGDKMTFDVVSSELETAAVLPPINESHVCPPQCP